MRLRRFRLALIFAFTLAVTGALAAAPVAAAHSIKVSGTARIGASEIFDLDYGHLTPPGTADIYYENTDGTHVFLVTSGGSKNRKFALGAAAPSYRKCRSVKLADHMTPMEQLPDGTYLCWKTSGHRYARVQILSHSTSEVDISYVTWTR